MLKKQARPLLVFYILHVYVLAQFAWWTYHIYDLNSTINKHEKEIVSLTHDRPANIEEAHKKLDKELSTRFWMVMGEGGVFLILLLLGGYYTRRAFKKEQALVNQQNNFLMSVTHEFKSPLASTKLTLETIAKKTNGNKEQLLVNNAITETDRLNNLVDNILAAAQMQSTKHLIKMQKQDLSSYLTNLIKKQQISKNITTNIQPSVKAEFDPNAMDSIINNLLENAVKYSEQNGSITVNLKENDSIIISVADEGKGIPDDKKVKVFEKFYRLGSEQNRNSKGTGLGLYIVKSLVEMHGGSIAIRNNKPTGSIFEIKLKQ